MKKRLLAALMAGAMALSMAACGNSNTDSTTQDTGSGDDAAAQAGDYNVGIVQLVPVSYTHLHSPDCRTGWWSAWSAGRN